MTSTATRLHTLILLLQRRPGQKAADLAETLGVSVRTVHRYLGMIEQMGVPLTTERGPYGGISLVEGYRLPPMVFTPEEAVAIYLGTSLVGQMWGTLYREPAQGAMAKLDHVLPPAQRDEIAWARRSLVATGMHRDDPDQVSPALETARRAARMSWRIRFVYQGASQAGATERLVDPYALVFRSGRWYLVGYCHLRTAMRTFRFDRIRALELLDERFERALGFDLQAHLEAELQDQPVVRARMRFAAEAAHLVDHNLWGLESTQSNPDGSLDVVLAAPDLIWLAAQALSYASWVTVLEPAELRHMVRQWALATAAQYPPEQIVEATT